MLGGIVFALIVVACMAYLVPMHLRRRGDEAEAEAHTDTGFARSMRVVSDHTPDPHADVSTPELRRAEVRRVARLDRLAAARRRQVLAVLGVGVLVVAAIASLGLISWWWVLAPVALIGVFVVVARWSVLAMRASFERRLARVRGEDEDAEETVPVGARSRGPSGSTALTTGDDEDERPRPVRRLQPSAPSALTREEPEHTATVVRGELDRESPLWQPVPISRGRVSDEPLAPRTVRTIDLSGLRATASEPGLASGATTPDAPEEPVQPGRTERLARELEAELERNRVDGGSSAWSQEREAG